MKAAATVLGASLLFFFGVLTGVGRREALPPPAAIPLGALNTPAGQGTSRPTAPNGDPGAAERTTTTTAGTGLAPADPTATTGAAPTPVATAPTATTAIPTGAPTTPSSTTTTRSGKVEQVDNRVECRSQGNGKARGKGEPCPSTTTSTGEAPGGGRTR